MKLKKINLDKIEQFLGGLKFAVCLIVLFSVAMIIGTFLESYYGTDFANRMVYKTFPFMLIQLCMLVSVIFTAFLRLPPKKRLYGFYVIHAGLVIIGAGSVITYIAGVDGSLQLNLNEPAREVVLAKDIIKIVYPDEGQDATLPLPMNGFPTDFSNLVYRDVTLLEYLPFAEKKFVWSAPINSQDLDGNTKQYLHSSRYFFENAFAKEDIVLSLHPEAAPFFQSSLELGPLSFYYLPEHLIHCFAKETVSKLIIWNTQNNECLTPDGKELKVLTTKENNRFIAFPDPWNQDKKSQKFLTFFPDFSPYPLDENLRPNGHSPVRALSKNVFEKRPTLFLFGNSASFYNKNTLRWEGHPLKTKETPLALPWMGAKITLLEHVDSLVPSYLPEKAIPIQKNGNLIRGATRAVRLSILGREYWVTNEAPLNLLVGGKKVYISVTKETLNLPFEIALTQFKMDTDPGTQNPASYESFVKLFDNGQMTAHHIFMNNPLKYGGFTFYQASYSQDEAGNYSSTLAVNVDQGRALKYLGSLMLVCGAFWHFAIAKRQTGAKENKRT